MWLHKSLAKDNPCTFLPMAYYTHTQAITICHVSLLLESSIFQSQLCLNTVCFKTGNEASLSPHSLLAHNPCCVQALTGFIYERSKTALSSILSTSSFSFALNSSSWIFFQACGPASLLTSEHLEVSHIR